MSSKKIYKTNKGESEHVDYSTEDKDQDGLNNSHTVTLPPLLPKMPHKQPAGH